MHKILIVDDDRRMRQMLREYVASFAFSLHEAADGREAVDACAAERPDWVLMDLRMKPVDGLHATAEIKALFPDIRIVILSEYDEASGRVAALRAGACAYVFKENLHYLPGILSGNPAGGMGAKPESAGQPGCRSSPDTDDVHG